MVLLVPQVLLVMVISLVCVDGDGGTYAIRKSARRHGEDEASCDAMADAGLQMMNLPASYIDLLKKMPADEIGYGVDGIKLFCVAELEQAQVGYSVAGDGKSL